MDTSSSSVPSSVATGEDKKPEVKKEPKEEEEGSGSTATNSSPASAQSKKKSKFEKLCSVLQPPLSACLWVEDKSVNTKNSRSKKKNSPNWTYHNLKMGNFKAKSVHSN